jgi:hypothetical protein
MSSGDFSINNCLKTDYFVNNTGVESVQIRKNNTLPTDFHISIHFKGRGVTQEIADKACNKTRANLSSLVKEYFEGSIDSYFSPQGSKQMSKARIIDWKLRHQNDNPILKLFRYIIFRIKGGPNKPRDAAAVTSFTLPKSSSVSTPINGPVGAANSNPRPIIPSLPAISITNEPDIPAVEHVEEKKKEESPRRGMENADENGANQNEQGHDLKSSSSPDLNQINDSLHDSVCVKDSIPVDDEDEFNPRSSVVFNEGPSEVENESVVPAFMREKTGVERLQHVWTPTNLKEADGQGIEHERMQGTLLNMIAARKNEILETTNRFKNWVKRENAHNSDSQAVKDCIRNKQIRFIEDGCGGSYRVHELDASGKEIPKWIVKPLGEDAYCIDNKKEQATPWLDTEPLHRVRTRIPLYVTPQNEALACRIAEIAGISQATPYTFLDILECPLFHDLLDDCRGELEASNDPEDKKILDQVGKLSSKTKLCSVQRYVSNVGDIMHVFDPTVEPECYDPEFWNAFDHSSFEEVHLLLLLLGENDGNLGNFLCQKDENGTNSIIKIDNGLIFPTHNQSNTKRVEYLNVLAKHPAMKQQVSEQLKQKIIAIDKEKIARAAKDFGREDGIQAFEERLSVLKELVQRPGMTLLEIEMRIALLGTPEVDCAQLPKQMNPLALAKSKLPYAVIEEAYQIVIEGNPEPLFPEHWDSNDHDIKKIGIFQMSRMIRTLRNLETEYVQTARPLVNRLYKQYPEEYSKINNLFLNGKREVCSQGTGGAQFISDAAGTQLVVKGFGTGLNEYKNDGGATPWYDDKLFNRVKRENPLYRSPLAAYLSWETARILGMPDITPKTLLAIKPNDQNPDILDLPLFSDTTKKTAQEKDSLADYVKKTIGERPVETLFSVQDYIQEKGVQEFTQLHSFWQKEVIAENRETLSFSIEDYETLLNKRPQTDEDANKIKNYQCQLLPHLFDKIKAAFSEDDYAKLQLLLWITGAMDFHTSNLMVYRQEGSEKWGMKMIDQDLTFPDANANFRNEIADWPQGQNPLPKEMIDKILALSVKQLKEVYALPVYRTTNSSTRQRNELVRRNSLLELALVAAHSKIGDPAFNAMLERIEFLQAIVNKNAATSMEEINVRMKLLGMQDEFEVVNQKKSIKSDEKLARQVIQKYKTAKELAHSELTCDELTALSKVFSDVDAKLVDEIRSTRTQKQKGMIC